MKVKTAIKGMIIFFSLLLAGLVSLLSYGLVKGTGELSAPGNGNWFSGAVLVNTQTFTLEDITDISVNNYSSDIFFLPSDDETLVIKEYVSSRTRQNPFVTINRDGSRLRLESDKYNTDSWLVFGNNYRCIEIYLPASYQNAVDIQTGSGDIFADMDLVFTDCLITGSSSDINLSKLTAETISITTASGDLIARQLGGEKKIATQSGTVTISGGSGNIEISTSSGDIRLEALTGDLSVSTSSGDLWVSDLTGSARARSSSGDMKIHFQSITGNLDVESSSGTVYCELPKDAGFRFRADTGSGDIRTYFDDSLSFDRKGTQVEGEIGGPSDLQVTVKTSSGDIKFNGK